MVELVDTHALGACAVRRGGSSPLIRTTTRLYEPTPQKEPSVVSSNESRSPIRVGVVRGEEEVAGVEGAEASEGAEQDERSEVPAEDAVRRFVPGLVFRFGSSACLSPGGRGAVCRATVSSRGLLSSLNGKATATAALVWLWESRTRMGGVLPVGAALLLSPTPPAADDGLAVRPTVVRVSSLSFACSDMPLAPSPGSTTRPSSSMCRLTRMWSKKTWLSCFLRWSGAAV